MHRQSDARKLEEKKARELHIVCTNIPTDTVLLIVYRVNGMTNNSSTNGVLSSIFTSMYYLGYVFHHFFCLTYFFFSLLPFSLFGFNNRVDKVIWPP